ncbi:MAG: 3-phosphoshikimate 1-carboxyvinyltransferase [Saprospiraceae bacterium]|nr:3-phosphoshikimate 1-carboxyvinyltransferase [Saprospiraceae bacterium]
MIYKIKKSERRIVGEITLAGSKSISNRSLIIRALCSENFPIHRLANAKDTQLLQELLASPKIVRDAGAAGTTFRFLTAYLAIQPDTQILTGTERMKKRPIGVLVDALRKLGADIEYLEEDGYPPLKINAPKELGKTHRLSISAGTSSQYISALLMIAPVLPRGLELTLEGNIVSRPYIEMTLAQMRYFGVESRWDGNTIKIAPQDYQGKEFTVEADWSAASYYYAMAAFADELDLQLNGLFKDSAQGDAVLASMMEKFNIKTEYNEKGIHLTKNSNALSPVFEYDFIECPDLAQTLAVICAGLGVKGIFTGLQTLSIKETDRIAALKNELEKVNATLSQLPPKDGKQYYQIEGQAIVQDIPVFLTYEDHRMAMAFAPLAMLGDIQIEDPNVVEKSYPDFWLDLGKLDFEITKV